MKITKRKIAWGVVLLILIVGGVICKKRWNVWFYNIPEIRYVLTEEPQRVLLTFGNDGELSRNVVGCAEAFLNKRNWNIPRSVPAIRCSSTDLPNFFVHWAGSVMPIGRSLKIFLMEIPTLTGYGMTIALLIGIRLPCNPIRLTIFLLYL